MTDTVLARRECDGHRFEIDADRGRLDIPLVHDFLANCSHWAQGIPRAVLERAIDHSLPFGLYRNGAQIGFARVVTDWATYAYLADVFVLPEARGQGLGQWMIETILAYEPLAGLRRWSLVTRDAASLYRRCGFGELSPVTHLERYDPQIYAR